MFKVSAKKTLTWPVTVSIPQDGGKTAKATFPAEFEVLSQDEMMAITSAGSDLLERVLVGWREGAVQDEGGEPLPYSEQAKAKLLQITYVRQALFAAYGELQNGREAARKN